MKMLATILSIIAISLMLKSQTERTKSRMMLMQAIETAVNIAKNVILGGYSGALMQFFGLARGILGARGSLNKLHYGLIMLGQLVIGHLLNTEGWVGYIPILASTSYTATIMTTTKTTTIRWMLIANLMAWTAYSLIIGDPVGALGNTGIAVFTLVQNIKEIRDDKQST